MLENDETAIEWTAGTNMPGYMPDSEPAGFATFGEARALIKGELESDMESLWQGDIEQADESLPTLNDLTDAAREVEAWPDQTANSVTVGNRAYWISRAEA